MHWQNETELLAFARHLEGSGRRSRVLPEYRAYIYSNNSMNSESWIEPYFDRISKLCSEQGPSPYWDRAYNDS